jgi:hypothetical protein
MPAVCVCSEWHVCPTVDIVAIWGVTVGRGMDWIMPLLTTYTHYWELQVVTELSLISTLYSSLLYTHTHTHTH